MNVRHIAVPDLVGVFGQFDARGLALAGLVEQAELDPCRMRREQREVNPLAVPSGTQRMRETLADRAVGHCDHDASLWLPQSDVTVG